MMRFPMTVLRVVTLGPALLVSFVLTVVVCALLPPALGLLAFLAAAGVLIALAIGQLEVPAIAALTSSRPATAAELQVMAPVLAGDGEGDEGRADEGGAARGAVGNVGDAGHMGKVGAGHEATGCAAAAGGTARRPPPPPRRREGSSPCRTPAGRRRSTARRCRSPGSAARARRPRPCRRFR